MEIVLCPKRARWTRILANKRSSKLRKHFNYGDWAVSETPGRARWTRNLNKRSKLRNSSAMAYAPNPYTQNPKPLTP